MALVELAAEIPCTELKPLGDIPKIELLGGVELKAFVDIAAGPATDCKLTFNLLLQLAPLLASMACLFKILNVITKIEEFATAATKLPDVSKILEAVPNLVGAIDDLKGCIPPFQIPQVFIMVKMMIQLVLRFLSCFLTQLDSLLEFRASIDLDSAEGNPVLREALTCAQNSADAAQANLLKSLEPLAPVMKIVGLLAGIVGLPLEIPNFASMSAGADVTATIGSVKQAVNTLQQVVDSIPG
jgi:hypothetical protein